MYRELLSWLLAKSHPIRDNVSAYFAHYYGQASLELLNLTFDPAVGNQTIDVFEKLTQWYQKTPYRQLEALHSLAQAHFQVGKHLEPEPHFRGAIRAIEQALRLVNPATLPSASRAHRLIADLGAYKFALGLTINKSELINESIEHYRSALKLISSVKAPSVFVEVAKGLFNVYYQQELWGLALDVFEQIEDAWSRIIGDAQLSGAVYMQAARQLSGEYTRAAWVLVQIGALERAALTLDRGRARQLNAALNVGLQGGSQLSASDQELLALAAKAIDTARLSATDDVCRKAWSKYLNLRRQLGLDAAEQQLSAESMRTRIPESGAIVQLLIAGEGAVAFILSRNEPAVSLVPLRQDTRTLLNSLFHQGSEAGQDTWMPAYRRYVEQSDDGTVEEPIRSSNRYNDWSALVTRARKTLGEVVFDPVHKALVERGLQSGAEVVICPPGELACLPLPMALLRDGFEFGSHWSASVAPRLSVLPQQAYSGSRHTLLAISPPVAHQCESLPFAEREAKLISDRFDTGARVYLPPEQVTLETVLHGLEKASVVHAACHGMYDWSEPERSGLLLADDRALTIRMLSSSVGFMRNARLAFLSACESGIVGATLVPDEFTGLPVSFLQAGVRAVIGTLWPVLDDAAMLICDRFYHYYLDDQGREKMPPARALSLAQTWLRQISVGELRELGYFSYAELRELCEPGSATSSRLRGLRLLSHRKASRTLPESAAVSPNQRTQPLDEMQNQRPFAAVRGMGSLHHLRKISFAMQFHQVRLGISKEDVVLSVRGTKSVRGLVLQSALSQSGSLLFSSRESDRHRGLVLTAGSLEVQLRCSRPHQC